MLDFDGKKCIICLLGIFHKVEVFKFNTDYIVYECDFCKESIIPHESISKIEANRGYQKTKTEIRKPNSKTTREV